MSTTTPTPGEIPAAAQSAGTHEIDAALTRVEGLDTDNIAEHVEAFEDAHRILQEHLHGAADG